MTPAPLSKVLKAVAEITRFDPVRNREQILDTINGVMGMLYRTPALRTLYFDVSECTTASTFHERCNSHAVPFMAVVMPPNTSNIREIRLNNRFFDITEERVNAACAWTILPNRNYDVHRPKAERLPKRLLEKEIPCNDSRQVMFWSTDDRDCGKLVGVRYLDLNGNEVREDVVLGPSPASTSVSVLEFLSITFPDRFGWINVATNDGCHLGKYHPSVYVPTHDWFRLEIGCQGMKCEYKGITEPMPYVFDTDFVPFSDKTIWRLALKAYEHLDSMELDSKQTSALARIYSQLSAVSDQDVSAVKTNFNVQLLPEAGKSMLSTGRFFSRYP